MTDKSKDSPGRLDSGGFAYGEIPKGFERIREPHEDAPLTRSSRTIYYTVSAIIVFVALMIVVLAIMERR